MPPLWIEDMSSGLGTEDWGITIVFSSQLSALRDKLWIMDSLRYGMTYAKRGGDGITCSLKFWIKNPTPNAFSHYLNDILIHHP
jgi:hypothetical protein